jgi:hypothetical protein
MLEAAGITLRIDQREFSRKKTPREKEPSIGRRLSRQEYQELKREEATRQPRRPRTLEAATEKKRSQTEMKDMQLVQADTTPLEQVKAGKKWSVASNRRASATNCSRIIVFNPQMLADFLRQERPIRTELDPARPPSDLSSAEPKGTPQRLSGTVRELQVCSKRR